MKHDFIHLNNQKAVADNALYFKEFYDISNLTFEDAYLEYQYYSSYH